MVGKGGIAGKPAFYPFSTMFIHVFTERSHHFSDAKYMAYKCFGFGGMQGFVVCVTVDIYHKASFDYVRDMSLMYCREKD